MERNHWILTIVGIVVLTAAIVVAIAVPLSLKDDSTSPLTPDELARQYMHEVPLIDGLVLYRPKFKVSYTYSTCSY